MIEVEDFLRLHVQPHVPGLLERPERDDVGVHGADGRAADHVDLHAQFAQRLPDAHLVGASRRAAGQHERRLLLRGRDLRLFPGPLSRFFHDFRAFSGFVDKSAGLRLFQAVFAFFHEFGQLLLRIYSIFRHSPSTSPIGSWMTRSARASAAVSDLLRITSLSPWK